MDKELHVTLFDALKGQESHFEKVVFEAVETSLTALGDQIYALDWANLAVSPYAAKAA